MAAIKRSEAHVSSIIDAITAMGHNTALLAKLNQLHNKARALQGQRDALDAAEPLAPLGIIEDVDASIQAVARDIEDAISHPSHPDSGVHGAFAGMMQAAGLVDRHSLDRPSKCEKPPALWARGLLYRWLRGPQPT